MMKLICSHILAAGGCSSSGVVEIRLVHKCDQISTDQVQKLRLVRGEFLDSRSIAE